MPLRVWTTALALVGVVAALSGRQRSAPMAEDSGAFECHLFGSNGSSSWPTLASAVEACFDKYGGGIVNVPAGNYFFDEPVQLRPGQWLRGHSIHSSTLASRAGKSIVRAADGDMISDLFFSMPATTGSLMPGATLRPALEIGESKDVQISNCFIENGDILFAKYEITRISAVAFFSDQR